MNINIFFPTLKDEAINPLSKEKTKIDLRDLKYWSVIKYSAFVISWILSYFLKSKLNFGFLIHFICFIFIEYVILTLVVNISQLIKKNKTAANKRKTD